MTGKDQEKPPRIPPGAFEALVGELRHTLRFMADAGCEGFDCSPETLRLVRRLGQKSSPVQRSGPATVGQNSSSVQPPAARRTDPVKPTGGAPLHSERSGPPVTGQKVSPTRPPTARRPEPPSRFGHSGKGVAGQNMPPAQHPPDGRKALSMQGEQRIIRERPPMPETLEQIRADLGDCRRCRLCERRTHIVFGAGNPGARLVFVGEGPGYEEDRSGQPFVGQAGQLLTKIIAAIRMTRESVYICNVIKCRPPGNRNPNPYEVGACFPFLARQLAAIRPAFICALGKFAAQTLLGTDLPISRLRGRFHTYRGIPVMPTFHPAYLLRNPERKREVWEDMKQLMRAMGHKI
ncbi:hypothetical protein DENIS_1105 [Desulfonema ishimotonii]|uniref:Type-4 uracil-DNA glycosylase n=1 Tax=Desulfonema ishimotonii TaxID=45657 RepID=A0A401FT80_9BACT|nr:uracil-DNA glycosylase [Desulfonema ishimotonii]GBC60160.1 hypothetical protein DENIS_1105 [Desulfonema ishimotonii]